MNIISGVLKNNLTPDYPVFITKKTLHFEAVKIFADVVKIITKTILRQEII